MSLLEKKIIQNLKARKKDFTIIQTTLSKKIITDKKTFFFVKGGVLKNIELGFLQKVKRHVEKNVDLKNYRELSAKQIRFIDSEPRIKRNVVYTKELYEIDLDKAFWKAALDYKIISEEIYLQGCNDKRLSKKCRLISLGNLAKQATQYEFKNGKFLKPIQLPASPTAKLFYYCANDVCDIMQAARFIADKGFFFYWVDAIFIQGEDNKKRVINYIESMGFSVKVYKLTSLQLKINKMIVRSHEHKNIEREFNFYKQNKKTIYE